MVSHCVLAALGVALGMKPSDVLCLGSTSLGDMPRMSQFFPDLIDLVWLRLSILLETAVQFHFPFAVSICLGLAISLLAALLRLDWHGLVKLHIIHTFTCRIGKPWGRDALLRREQLLRLLP